jgi:hypothetical protein
MLFLSVRVFFCLLPAKKCIENDREKRSWNASRYTFASTGQMLPEVTNIQRILCYNIIFLSA